MEENNANINNTQPKKCDGHCETCNINQRTYCAAQMAYYAQGEISQIKAILARLEDKGDNNIILQEKCAETEDKSVIPPDAQ